MACVRACVRAYELKRQKRRRALPEEMKRGRRATADVSSAVTTSERTLDKPEPRYAAASPSSAALGRRSYPWMDGWMENRIPRDAGEEYRRESQREHWPLCFFCGLYGLAVLEHPQDRRIRRVCSFNVINCRWLGVSTLLSDRGTGTRKGFRRVWERS